MFCDIGKNVSEIHKLVKSWKLIYDIRWKWLFIYERVWIKTQFEQILAKIAFKIAVL